MTKITISKEGARWIARFPFDWATKDLVKAAGFRFDGTSKLWWTSDATIAAKLDPNAAAQANRAIDLSRAVAVEAAVAATVPVPEGLAYLPYQVAGIAYAMSRPATLIGDEMGLGKTIQAVGVVNADPSVKTVLVVCPASLKINWARELGKWLVRPSVIAIGGGKPTQAIRDALISLGRLDNQKRLDASQKSEHVIGAGQPPHILPLDALDRSVTKAGIETGMLKPTILNEEINYRLVGGRETDLPGSINAAANPTLAINNARHVSEHAGVVGNAPTNRTTPPHPKSDTVQPTIMIPNGGSANAQSGDDLGKFRALINAFESSKQCNVSYTSGTGHDIFVLILNYDILNDWRSTIDAIDLSLLISDECHYVKNAKAQRTQALLGRWNADAAKRVEPIKAGRRLFLSGTPIVNRPAELWTLVRALDPFDLGRNFMKFMERYTNAHHNGYGWDYSGAANLDELQQRMRAKFLVRRLKADVLTELPAKRRQIIVLAANGAGAVIEAERAAYDASQARVKAAQAAIEAARASGDRAAYEAAVRSLRDAQTYAFSEMSKLRHDTAVAKIPHVIDHVTECLENEGKVVLFCHHHDVVNALREAFPTAAVVTGETPVGKRQLEVDRFQIDPACRVFIGSIQAAGVGLTLTAAHHVVFAELDWVPGNVSQAEDRLHRIGQRNSVLVQHLVFDNSIDARMANVIVEKQSVIDAALDSPTGQIEAAELPEATQSIDPIAATIPDDESVPF